MRQVEERPRTAEGTRHDVVRSASAASSSRTAVRRQIAVGSMHDPTEAEADHVAGEVLRRLGDGPDRGLAGILGGGATGKVRRRTDPSGPGLVGVGAPAPRIRRSGAGQRAMIRRHNLPMPAKLVPNEVVGEKQPWTVADVLGDDLVNLKAAIQALIPADSKKTPEERIASLVYVDCPTPDVMAEKAGAENRNNAAKAAPGKGIFFNNSLSDYYTSDGSPNVDMIRTTVVHESMHFVSADHAGVQEYADLLSPTKGQNTVAQLQPDEAITDYLSLQVYEKVFGTDKPYITAYWVAASANVASSASADARKTAQDQQLPIAWTGDMVEILKTVLGIDDTQLKAMYFEDPGAFGKAIEGKRADIQAAWTKKMGQASLKAGVLSAEYEPTLFAEVVREELEDLKKAPDDKTRGELVRAALQKKGVGFTSAMAFKNKFSDKRVKDEYEKAKGAS